MEILTILLCLKQFFIFNFSTMSFKIFATLLPVVWFIFSTANELHFKMNEIGMKLGLDYGEIGGFMQKNGLIFSGHPMAWYYTQEEPFIMVAGVPVDREPASPPGGRIEVIKLQPSKAVVLHFWGPYELTGKAYAKITDWLKKNNKQADGPPFDVYITDPTTVKDPYQVQTDIYQPIK